MQDLESHFSVEELFVSRTNKKGIIQTGNNVFVRVSDYNLDELVDKPHNVIRHPDMPRCVFKLMWNEIGSGKIFCGYVKNRSKNGKHYWVFACVFPTKSGYISVRLKPTSSLFPEIISLYKDILSFEEKQGMNEALEYMLKRINEMGFVSYDYFMRHALMTELFSRDDKVKANSKKMQTPKSSIEGLYIDIQQILERVTGDFKEFSRKQFGFTDLQKQISDCAAKIESSFLNLESLSINMAIAAHNLGQDGRTLVVVANTFQKIAAEVLQSFKRFKEMSQEIMNDSEKAVFTVLSSRALIEMLTFQIHENLIDLQSGKIKSQSELLNLVDDARNMNNEIVKLFTENVHDQRQFLGNLQTLSKSATEIKDLITRLDLIRVGGKLEGERSQKIADLFGPFIDQMNEFILPIDEPLKNLIESSRTSSEAFDTFVQSLVLLEHSIHEVALLLNMSARQTEDLSEEAV
jgi:aerotaxis receptor